MTYRVILIIAAVASACAADILLFPGPTKSVSAETMPYWQMLHTGVERDTFYMRGRFGVDFPIARYQWDEDSKAPRRILFGINAAAHINMRPAAGMRFPVDNLYAVLALNFSGGITESLTWRLYPVYHVSAHLADGYPSDILKSGVRPVSSEMVRGEMYWKPLGDMLELGAGAGWYYHVCAQKELLYRADLSILLTPAIPLLNVRNLQPFVLIRAENVYQGKNYQGFDTSAGLLATAGKRGFGLSLRCFNRLHSSYYFEEREKGWGAEYMFIY
ncbi:MAG: hypothetical protein FWB85_08235 [Chitinispirillia bacterium]|nr:hypothetical protein [Chitinispirillia bacterium]MCL2242246.1 hypothetical protein [Chitinispirillia bacterium]